MKVVNKAKKLSLDLPGFLVSDDIPMCSPILTLWSVSHVSLKGLSLKQIKQIFFGRWEHDFKLKFKKFYNSFENTNVLSKVVPEYKTAASIKKISAKSKKMIPLSGFILNQLERP